jgi:hypothetical protein
MSFDDDEYLGAQVAVEQCGLSSEASERKRLHVCTSRKPTKVPARHYVV